MTNFIENFGNTTEVCGYTKRNFNVPVTARDVDGLRHKFQLIDDRTNAVRMKDLLRGLGTILLLIGKI